MVQSICLILTLFIDQFPLVQVPTLNLSVATSNFHSSITSVTADLGTMCGYVYDLHKNVICPTPVVRAVKPKARCKFHMGSILHYTLHKITLTEVIQILPHQM